MTATGPSGPPPRRSSASVNVRPRIAGTPSVSKKRPLAHSPSTSSDWPPRARLKRVLDHAKAPSKTGAGRASLPRSGWSSRPRGLVLADDDELLGRFHRQLRRIRLSRMEKIALLAPIPSASDRIATIETTGVDLQGSERITQVVHVASWLPPVGRRSTAIGWGAPPSPRVGRVGVRGEGSERLQQHDLHHDRAVVPVALRQKTLADVRAQDRVPWRPQAEGRAKPHRLAPTDRARARFPRQPDRVASRSRPSAPSRNTSKRDCSKTLNEYNPRSIASSPKRTPDAGTPWILVSSNRPN